MKYVYLLIFLLVIFTWGYSQNSCLNLAPVHDLIDPTITYLTVQIGSQCWLKENLNTGTRIKEPVNQTNNGIIEKYCYNNDPANCTTYGGIYQWDEAMNYATNEGAQGICPSGWHIPTYAEFSTLATTVSNDGNSLKAVGQGTGSGAGTNTSGFSALLAGQYVVAGGFILLGSDSPIWTSTEYDAGNSWLINMYDNSSDIHLGWDNKSWGFSVRCVNNNLVGVNDNDKSELPKEFSLFQNYPNPWNPTTTIDYSIGKEGNVKLNIYNAIGSKVATIVDEYKSAGNYSVQFNGSNLASGIYLYRLESGSYSAIKKFILIK